MSAPPISFPRRLCSTVVVRTARGDERKKNITKGSRHTARSKRSKLQLSACISFCSLGSCVLRPGLQSVPRTLSSKPRDVANNGGMKNRLDVKTPHFFILGGVTGCWRRSCPRSWQNLVKRESKGRGHKAKRTLRRWFEKFKGDNMWEPKYPLALSSARGNFGSHMLPPPE